MQRPQTAIKLLLKKMGVYIERVGLYNSPDQRLVNFLYHHSIEYIIDIGANKGQFASSIFEAGFRGKLYSIEALPNLHKDLKAAADRYPSLWSILPPMALAEETGTAKFHVTRAHASSSLLAPTDNARHAPEHFGLEKEILVESRTLDSILQDLGIDPKRTFLKIDVQGAEMAVLRGASQVMPHIGGVEIEQSLQTYYKGQHLADEVHSLLRKYGLTVWDITPVWREKSMGRLDQIDVVYFREG